MYCTLAAELSKDWSKNNYNVGAKACVGLGLQTLVVTIYCISIIMG